MSEDFILKGGRVIDPASGIDAEMDVLVSDGKVTEVGQNLAASAEVIDVAGSVVAPGLVDVHVHLREPGREDEETIASGSACAAMGGFNAVCAMPNTDPACDNASVAEKIRAAGSLAGLVEVIPAGALTKGRKGLELAQIGEMARSSARVKLFTDDGTGVQDARLLRRAMEYLNAFGGICAEHCEDEALSAGGHMHEGEVSSRLGLPGIPAEAEETALARDLALARLTGVRFHVQHVSTARGLKLIEEAKAEGLDVTVEVTPHHLCFTDSELESYDPNFKVNPPLRPGSDVEALREGLASGAIDMIATDHAPHAPEEKEGEFELAPPGMLGLETALSVINTELILPGVITWTRAIEAMSVNPARLLGLDRYGGPFAPGSPANLVVFDPEVEWEVSSSAMESLSRNTPWEGRSLKGRVTHTVFEGRFVVRASTLVQAAVV
jgi:dihydroorotase